MTDSKPYCYAHPHPAVTTDVALFTLRDGALNLLLIRRGQPPFEGSWALPGGFVEIDEDPADGAARELAEETGAGDVALTQVGAFGTLDRDPRERIISIAYVALERVEGLRLRAGDDAAEASWFRYAALPALAFDHDEIIAQAHRRLGALLVERPLALRFLPDTFTLEELRGVHEALLDAEIDKRNLIGWAVALEHIEPTGIEHPRQGRPATQRYRARTGDGRE